MTDWNPDERRNPEDPEDSTPREQPPREEEREEEWTWQPPDDGRVFGVEDPAPHRPPSQSPEAAAQQSEPPSHEAPSWQPPHEGRPDEQPAGYSVPQQPPEVQSWQGHAQPAQPYAHEHASHQQAPPPGYGYGTTAPPAPAATPLEKDSVKLVVALVVAMTSIFLVACLGPCAFLGVAPGAMVVWIALQEKKIAAQYGQKNRIAELTLWLGVKVIILSVLMAILSFFLLMLVMPDLAEQIMQMSSAPGG